MEINVEKKSNLKQVIKFIWNILKDFPFSGIIVIISISIYSSNGAITTYATKNILDVLEKNDINNLLYDLKSTAVIYIIVLSIIAISCTIGNFFEKVKIMPKLYKKITELAFIMVIKQNYNYHQNNLSGNLGNKIHDLATSIPTIIKLTTGSVLYIAIGMISSFYALSLVDTKYVMILVIWLFIFTPLALFFIKKITYWSKKLAESQSYIAGKIVNIFLNIFPIKLFCGTRREKNYLNSHLEHNMQIETTSQKYFIYFSIYAEISFIFIQIINLLFLISDRMQGLTTIGDFALILSLSSYIVSLTWIFTIQTIQDFLSTYGKISQALQVIQEEPSIKDHPSATELSIMKGEIIFDKVCFGYQDNDNIFTDKSIKIHGGQSVGLVGFSGSGKSSFVNLILRFFEVNEGEILIDGQSIKSITQDSLHKNIGVIPQNPTLFNRSIMDNIRYGRHDASNEEVIEAAKKARIHDFVMTLPEKYDTMIDEHSSVISGGQKQRLAIARVILKNAPILIMDEATSALDTITENEIHSLLKEFMRDKTTIIIAHRLSTLSDVDRILVFDKGKIVEDGSGEELIKLNGLYKEFCTGEIK